jgi:uncharacterized membrane protein
VQTTIPASFICLELCVYVLFAWGLYAAIHRSRLDAMTLVAACLFGFVIEYLFSTPLSELPHWLYELMGGARAQSGNSYKYARFLIAIEGVPLWIILGWASIIHSAMRTTSRLGFGLWRASLADGLLAASLDFSLDPIAESVGFWKWDIVEKTPGLSTAFGIPLDNFLGWMMIVGTLSLTLRLSSTWIVKWGSRFWIELGFIVASLVVSLAMAVELQNVYDWLYWRITPAGTFMLVFGTAALLTVTQLPWLRRDQPIDYWTLSFVSFLHVYMLSMLFIHRVYDTRPALLGLMPLLAIGSLLAYAWPSIAVLHARFSASRARTSENEVEAVPAQPAN